MIGAHAEAAMPFLTDLAPDARIKGSRDPLGFLPIWSRVGRKAIHNVTTVSGDADRDSERHVESIPCRWVLAA